MSSISFDLLDEQMSDNDKTFYNELGDQVATLRKEQHITQVQMAQMLGISQQLVAAYEAGDYERAYEGLISVLAQNPEFPHARLKLVFVLAALGDLDAAMDECDRAGDAQRDKLKLELGRCTKKLANENFVNNAPESVVRKERERLEEFEKTIAKLDDQLEVMEALERPD